MLRMTMTTDMSVLKDDRALCCLSAYIITITYRVLYPVSVVNFTADSTASKVPSTTVYKNTSKYGHP